MRKREPYTDKCYGGIVVSIIPAHNTLTLFSKVRIRLFTRQKIEVFQEQSEIFNLLSLPTRTCNPLVLTIGSFQDLLTVFEKPCALTTYFETKKELVHF